MITLQMKVKVGVEKRQEILTMLESDVHFLSKLKIMDYSLLLGIHNVARVRLLQSLVEYTRVYQSILEYTRVS